MASNTSSDLSLLLVAKLDPTASETTIKQQLQDLQQNLGKTTLSVNVEISKESLDSLKQLQEQLKQLATLQKQVGATGGTSNTTAARMATEATKQAQIEAQANAKLSTENAKRNNLYAANDRAEEKHVADMQVKNDRLQQIEDRRAAQEQKALDQKSKELAQELRLQEQKAQAEQSGLATRINSSAAFQTSDPNTLNNAINPTPTTHFGADEWTAALDKRDSALAASVTKENAIEAEQALQEQAALDKRIMSMAQFQSTDTQLLEKALTTRQGLKRADSAQWEQMLSKDEAAQQKAADAVVKAQEKEAAAAKAAQDRDYNQSFAGKFSTALDGLVMWSSTATLIFGTLRQIKDGFNQITELDTAMVGLKKVTDESSASYAEFAKNANVMADNLGSSTVAVIKATTEFARLGYTFQQAQSLASTATLYSNVGDMSVDSASQALIGAVKGFGVELDSQQKNITHIVDAYNEVGNHFAISSAGIGEAVKRSASALHEAGNSMEQSVAMIAAANSTVQDPETVGTALKTIAMRLRGVNEAGDPIIGMTGKLEGAFNKIGLTMMKDNDTFKSTFEIMQDLSKVWGTLTDIQRADILDQVAGKRQGNIVAGMMNNWQDAEKSLQMAVNSAGSAAKENATYMDSIQAKQAQAANAVTGFWQTVTDSGPIKTALTIFTDFIKVITTVTNVFGGLPAIIGVVVFAMDAFAVKTGVTSAVLGGQTGIVAMLGNAYLATAAKVEAAGGAIAFFENLLASGVIGLAITALVAGLGYLVKMGLDAYHAHDELVKKLSEEVAANQKTEASVRKLSDEYTSLSQKTNLTAAEKQRLSSVQSDLAKQMPELIDHYDAEGNVILKTASATAQLVEQLKKENAERAYTLALEKKQEAPKLDKTIADSQSAFNAVNGDVQANQAKLEGLKAVKEITATLDKNQSDYEAKIQAGLARIVEIYKQHGLDAATALGDIPDSYFTLMSGQVDREISLTEKALADGTAKAQAAVGDSKKAIEQERQILSGMTAPTDVFMKDAGPNFDKVKQALLSSITDLGAKSGTKFDDMASAWEKAYGSFVKSANDQKIDFNGLYNTGNAVDNMKALEDQMLKAGYAPAVVTAAMKLLRGELDNTTVTTYNLNTGMSTYVEALASQSKNIDLLAKAYQELQRGQSLSLEEIHNLILAHPNLAKEVTNTNGKLTLQAEALHTAGLEAGQTAKDVIVAEQAKAEAVQRGLEKSIAATAIQLQLDEAMVKSKGALNAMMQREADVNGGSGLWSDQGKLLMNQTFALDDAKAAVAKLQQEAANTSPQSMWNSALADAIDHNHDPAPPKPSVADETRQPFQVNVWEHEIANQQLALAKLEVEKKKYTETDKEFLDIQRQEIDVNRKIQDQYAAEGAHIRGEIIPSLDSQLAQFAVHSKEWDKLAQMRDDQVKKLEGLSQNWWGAESKIQDMIGGNAKKDDWLANVKKEMADTQKLFDEQINQSQAKQADMDKNSQGYRDELHAQNDILRQRVDYEDWILKLLKEEQARLEERMKTENLTGSVLQAVKARLLDVKGVISDTTKSISTQNETIAKNSKAWEDSVKSWHVAAKKLADEVVNAYKEVQKAVRDAQIAALDDLRKVEDTRHNDAVKNMDDEAKLYEQNVNDKIKDIDRVYQAEQDKKNLAREEDVRAKLVTQIDKMALDNSVEGRAKLADLQKQLKAQDDKMQDQRDKNTHDARKTNLQNELDTYKRNKTTEKITEDDRHNAEIKHFDELKKQYDKQYDDAINNEDKIKKLRDAVFAGNMKYVREQLNTYFGAFTTLADGTMGGIGKKIQDNLDLGQKLLDLLDKVNGGNGQTPLPAPPGTDTKNTQGDAGTAITENSGKVDTQGMHQVQAYEQYVYNKIKSADIFKQTGKWDKGLADQNQKAREFWKFDDMTTEQAQAEWDKVKAGAETRFVNNKVAWWTAFNDFGTTNTDKQIAQAADNDRLRQLFGFADLTQDDLKLKGDLPFGHTERDKALQTLVDNKRKWKKDGEKLQSVTDENEKTKIRAEMAQLSQDNVGIRGHADWNIHDYSEAELRRLNVDGFAGGGYTGTWAGNGGRIVAVHPEEYILKKDDTKNILQAAQAMRSILLTPGLFQSKQVDASPAGVTIGHISLTIEHLNGDEQGGKTVFKTLVDELSRTRGVKL